MLKAWGGTPDRAVVMVSKEAVYYLILISYHSALPVKGIQLWFYMAYIYVAYKIVDFYISAFYVFHHKAVFIWIYMYEIYIFD